MSDGETLDHSLSGVDLKNKHYHMLVNAVTDYAIYGLDRQGRVTDWNSGAQRITGYQPQEIVGRHFSRFYTPEDQAEGEPHRALGVVAREGRFEGEGWRVRNDGSRFWADVVIENILDDRSVAIGYVKVTRDVTERRNAAKVQEAQARELRQALGDLTAALAQRDLLLQEVYHRVKNNLQAIDSIIGLQIQRLKTPEAKTALGSLRSRIFTLGLVHSQLMGSKDLKTFDIAPFLDELTRNLVDSTSSAGVSVTLSAAPLKVGLDFAAPMALLVTELVTNALKHAFPTGQGRIDISLGNDQGGALRLVVADNGRGIQRPPDPMAPQNGLGHQLVKNLTRQLKGTLAIESVAGTRVEINFPPLDHT